MTALLLGHAVVGLLILAGAHRLRRVAFLAGAVPMLAVVAFVAARAPRVLDGDAVSEHLTWVGSLRLGVDLRMDGFGLLMAAIVAGVGVLVMVYAHSYFSATEQAARIAGLLVWFSGAMLGVVLADNVLFLYVAWELTSITSWLLIGSDHANPSARAGALHALLVTGTGGLALLGGLVLLAQAAGTYSLSGILAAAPSGTTAVVGLALVLVGVVTKSAQYPTHAWLPGAMVAPTPISAYLHSATMVKAGIYLAARLAPVFALTGGWRPAAVTIGVVTMLAGGLRALRQQDLKLLLAMGTVSQLGFLLVLFGAGRPDATVAGATLILAHALFKAALFLVVGMVDHQAGTRDRRELPPLGEGWGTVKAVTLVSAASMAGLPPLFGFVAKESAFEAFTHEGAWGALVLAGLVAGSILTFAYSARFATAILVPRGEPRRSPVPPSLLFAAPAVLLAGLSVVTGLAGGTLVGPLLDQASADLDARVEHVSVALWHGFELPLLLSVVVVAGGALLVAARRAVARWQAALAPRYGADDVFAGAVQGLTAVARRVTGVVQSGSLPVYVAVILLSAVALTGASMLLGDDGSLRWPEFAETPAQVALAVLIAGAAVAAATLGRRFAAILVLGAVGYGMALVFVIQGAPDLALTQLAIETLFIVVFMLVLRRLPTRFGRPQGGLGVGLRVGVAAIVAAGVFTLTLASASHRVPSPVSDGLVERASPEAGGHNVVNVVLVDFRGLDTLGEISVLVVAGVGVVALARAGRGRAGSDTGDGDPGDGDPGDGGAGDGDTAGGDEDARAEPAGGEVEA